MRKPTLGSVFSGIGGIDLGFERAGFETVWQVEINDYCRKVLAKNFPAAERYADIRECGVENLKPVDVVAGGFPCQDISNAGLRAGIGGGRSGLWKHMHRIIGELRPKIVLVENVAALLGRGMGVVLGDLAEIGYDAEWKVISAADMGAPHLRERVWIMAHDSGLGWGKGWQGGLSAVCEGKPEQPLQMAYSDSVGSYGPWQSGATRFGVSLGRCYSQLLCDTASQGFPDRPNEAMGEPRTIAQFERSDWWAVEPNVGRVAHGVPNRVDRLRGLGNAVVPQIPEMYARCFAELLRIA
jgi:DNA (cytosine-5)-methyltransferase 1